MDKEERRSRDLTRTDDTDAVFAFYLMLSWSMLSVTVLLGLIVSLWFSKDDGMPWKNSLVFRVKSRDGLTGFDSVIISSSWWIFFVNLAISGFIFLSFVLIFLLLQFAL